MPSFDDLFPELGRDRFNAEHWVTAATMTRPTPDLIAPLLDDEVLCDLDRLVDAGHHDYKLLASKGAGLVEGPGEEARRLWHSGEACTVPAGFLQITLASVDAYCKQLMHSIGPPFRWSWPNVYYSRQGSGFSRHWDNHENFIVGLRGTKRFSVAPNGVMKYPQFNAGLNTRFVSGPSDQLEAELAATDLPGLVDYDVGPGDCLFIPRGWWHEAAAQSGDSVTLTFAMHTCNWADLLQAGGLPIESSEPVALRTPLPLVGHEPPEGIDLDDESRSRLPLLFAQAAMKSVADVVTDWNRWRTKLGVETPPA